MSIFEHFQARYEAAKDEELSIQDFLALCKENKSAYANAAERLLLAIGEPEMIIHPNTRALAVFFPTE